MNIETLIEEILEELSYQATVPDLSKDSHILKLAEILRGKDLPEEAVSEIITNLSTKK